ncbi:hypothetical protein BGZ49_000586 [Haplosporangium sp. Z 27]|nr:hypothetical protein BGZ49_000586 [Haplosporangium sp. Z 27]
MSTRRPCRFYLAGNCRNGADCNFYHASIPQATLTEATTGTIEQSSNSPSQRTGNITEATSSSSPSYARPCHWYMAGYCLRGDSCWFSHDRSAINGSRREIVDLDDGDDTTTGVSRGQYNLRDNDNSDDDEDQKCAICFEIPKTFGLLVSCNHAFCLTCIRTWRSKETAADLQPHDSTNASVTKACPNCRTPSLYVVPSSFFPTCPEQKEIIIQNYKEAAARKACKYFTESGDRHWCPFGDGCFFAHLDENGEPCKVNPDSNPRRIRQHRRGARVNRDHFGHREFYSAYLQMRQEVLETMRAANPDSSEDDLVGFESLLAELSRLSTSLQSSRGNITGSRWVRNYGDEYDDEYDDSWLEGLEADEDDFDDDDEEDQDDDGSDYEIMYTLEEENLWAA